MPGGEPLLEERSFRRHSIAAREAVRTRSCLAQGAVFKALVDQLGRLEPELPERLRWPPGFLITLHLAPGRLRDDQPAPDLEQGCGTLGHHRRTPEGTGQCPVEASPQVSLTPAHLCPLLEHRDPAGQPQMLYRPAEEGSTPGVGLHERHGGLHPVSRHHQSGQPASRTQVDEPGGAGGRQTAGDGCEPLGVPDLTLKRTGSEESRGASLGEELVQHGGGVAPLCSAGHRRRVSPLAR